MANISSDISNEQIIALLQMLFTNMNNLDKLYYDMFINQTPMTLTLERYNENGVIETFELPNRAKDRINVLQGRGEPERVQGASAGTIYLDVLTSNVWVKTTDSGSTGWIMLYTPSNFLKGREYIAPDGDASALTGLSAGSITGGIMDVRIGGTGTQGITGLVKGRGSALPFIAAQPGRDYLEPKTFIGSLGLFLIGNKERLPEGWLPCDGSAVMQADYPDLYNYLQNIYPNNSNFIGEGDERHYLDDYGNPIYVREDQFALPDFRNKYIKGWEGEESALKVGDYQPDSIPNITGQLSGLSFDQQDSKKGMLGAFSWKDYSSKNYKNGAGSGTTDKYALFNAANSSDACKRIFKDNVKEINVKNISVLICIFAGLPEIQEEVNV